MRNLILSILGASVLAFGATGARAQSVTISSPAAGATVASPLHVVASATAGSYPVSAMRLYVDNQSIQTVYAAALDSYATLANGQHYVAVVGWDTSGKSFSRSMYVTVGTGTSGTTAATATPAAPAAPATTSGTTGVSIAAPSNGASVTSPVQFAASATAPAGRTITAIRIYLDNTSVYLTNSSSLNTAINAGLGSHNAVVQAWDSAGAVYKSSATINVVSSGTTSGGTTSGGSTSGTVAPSPSATGPYQSNFSATSNWMATQSLPDGALLYSTARINPYYSNLAAAGLVKDPQRHVQVQQWMQWYINHLNWPDKWGIYGTMYDYNIVNGQEVSDGDADSTDSYAATFLSLAWAYYQTGDPAGQTYVRGLAYQLDAIGGVLVQTQQPDGLTWAKPDYQIKYLMDNCEAYRGLRDLASLFQALGDTAKQAHYTAAADSMLQGIQGMWMNGKWAVYKAALMGDNARVDAYISTIQQKYVNTGFPWTWYTMEAGWFMRLNAYMMGSRPF